MARSNPFGRRARAPFVALGAAFVALAALAACTQILGLDAYKNCEDDRSQCDAGPDGGADSQADSQADATTDGGADAEPVFPQGSTGADWITFRMGYRDGGLVDASTFPDGQPFIYDPVERDYQELLPVDAGGNAAVVDTVTKRTWLVTAGTTRTDTFANADSICSGKGARVATRVELLSILDSTQDPTDAGPGMVRPEVVGIGNRADAFWSSTAVRNSDGTFSFWTVSFKTGETTLVKESATEYGVLCVLK